MERRPRLIVLAALIVGLCFAGFCRTAWAQNKAVETQARALQKKAMDEDFLNVDFNKAADKLNQAIAKCGTDKCGANLRALLRRDLATIYSAASKKDEALKAMGDALKIDGSVQLDPNFKTKELEAIYAEARKGGGAGGAGAAGGGGGGSPSGDFTHTPPTEQTVRTPLPIYVEYGGSEAVTKVVVKYKAFGMTEFKTLELKKVGMGFGANIPCIDIQEGSIQYYVQGFTANNDPVATSGDRNNPYTVTISKTISGDAPHLPGQEAPAQCPDTGDCPPNFPGCKKGGAAADNLKGEGADCVEDGECKSGTCKDEKCTAPPAEASTEDKLPFRRVWIGVGGSLDFQFLSAAQSVCSLNTTSAQPVTTYACTIGGSDFPGDNKLLNSSIPHGSNQPDAVNGGLSPGNIRILASFDYALNHNFLVGARAGVVLLTYPGSELSAFPPLHLEARATLVIGKDALVTKGIHPVVFLGGGVSQFSTSVSLGVNKCTMNGTSVAAVTPTPPPPGGGTVCPAGSTTVAGSGFAWQVGGPGFASPGGGIRWIIADRVAATLNVNFVLAFGGSVGFLFAPSPELGVQVGF